MLSISLVAQISWSALGIAIASQSASDLSHPVHAIDKVENVVIKASQGIEMSTLKNGGHIQVRSSSALEQSLASNKNVFGRFCYGFNGEGAAERKMWHHWFKKAECDRSNGDRRAIKLTCGSQWREFGSPQWNLADDKVVRYACEERTYCSERIFINDTEGGPVQEVECVDEENVKTETVSSKPDAAHHGHPNLHCGLDLQIPGTHYRAVPGQKSMHIILTEEVYYPNGQPYSASQLYIREKSNKYGLDPVFRQGASVASLQIEVGFYRGQWQQREFEFCMQMLPGLAVSSVIFTYSFFKVDLQHGRVPPKAPRLALEAVESQTGV